MNTDAASLAAALVPPCAAAGPVPPAGPFDPRVIRKDFPILNVTVRDGRSLAYLDNAATTQKPASIVCALCDYYQACNANVHRSLHYLAEQATERFEGAREKVRAFLNASDVRSVIFTRGTTEGINLVAWAWARRALREGDEIILTEMEHHSNLVPWQLVARDTGARLKFIPVLDDGTLDLAAYERLLSKKTRLVSFMHISNVLGTVNPARRIIELGHAAGARVLVDAAQSAPNRTLDVRALDCDWLAFSGHKMMGPTGIGVLYGKTDLLESMDPFLCGGEMINRVTLEDATWADLPQKFEAGTPHVSGAIGLGAAVDYLQRLGLDTVQRYEERLTAYTLRRLGEVPGLRIFGRAADRTGAVSFEVEGVHPHDLAQFADRDGIAIRAGHMCAQPLMRKLGVPAVSRASLYIYNLEEEVDRLVESILKAREFFRHGTR